MCGLVAIFHTRDWHEPDQGQLDRMNERQHHRGPDEGGLHTEPAVGLGHRRLSIIDLSEGQQPMASAGGDTWLVYNGEIYNFRELRTELEACGRTFRTHSDTEVILHAWAVWGEDCVSHLRGMFAFVLWDRGQQVLFAARDRLGVKPLYYSVLNDGRLLLASELKGLTCHPELDRSVDYQAVEDYLAFGYVPEPRSIYRRVAKLSPGHTLSWRHGQSQPQLRRYWDLPFKPLPIMTDADAQAELTARLRQAVQLRLVSEVPLGAFLSGGVDSSCVVAMMAQSSAEPVNTCAIGFGEGAFDESSHAQAVANHYHTRHTLQQVDPADFSLLDTLGNLYDEPFSDSSALPTYRVCQMARERVTVALSGDGGDEALAGYRRYGWQLQEQRLRDRIPAPLRRVAGALGNVYPDMPRAPRPLRARATLRSLGRDSVAGYMQLHSVLDSDTRQLIYSDALQRELQGYCAVEVMYRHAKQAPTDDPLSLVQYLDFKTYLPGDILTKVDRASMAHGLEVREPLLDHELLEWVSGLSNNMKIRDHQAKWLLKKAMEPHLPNDILYRRKQGFSVPLVQWFRGPLRQRVRDALLGQVLADTGWFKQRGLQQLLAEHEQGVRDRSQAMWSLLMLEGFLRREVA